LRFIAATLVLITHSFALSSGDPNAEPLRTSLGITWGSIAVDIFFVTSGFLVTGSLVYRQNLYNFVVARALRIYPALWAALSLTVLVVGIHLTTLSAEAFFSDAGTWKYLAKNALLATGIAYYLPGTFMDNPWPRAVNGSLWSLPLEIKMYAALAITWSIAKLFGKNIVKSFAWGCIALMVTSLFISLIIIISNTQSNLHFPLIAMFFSGATIQVLKNRIPISSRLFLLVLTALLISTLLDRGVFEFAYQLAIPYLVMYLALVPTGAVRHFNKLGDYSYGIYIYAFPIQQALAHYWKGIGSIEMIAFSFPITLVLAFASWHLIEKRALSFKTKIHHS